MATRTFAVLGLAFLAAVAFVTVGLSPETGTRVVVESDRSEHVVDVEVADDPQERYTGLSETDSLGPNEGMLFVYAEEGHHTYVMRSMSFPIDIVYIGANGTITEIHHAPVEEDNEDLTGYSGRGQWVLEVPYNWTAEHDVEVGDTVRIEVDDRIEAETEGLLSAPGTGMFRFVGTSFS